MRKEQFDKYDKVTFLVGLSIVSDGLKNIRKYFLCIQEQRTAFT